MPLDFRRHRHDRRPEPRFGSSRSLTPRMRWRVFALLGALLLVMAAMRHARQPSSWYWVWNVGRPGSGAEAEGDLDTRLSAQVGRGSDPTGGAESEPLLLRRRATPWEKETQRPRSESPPNAAVEQAFHALQRGAWSQIVLDQLTSDEKAGFLTALQAARNRRSLTDAEKPAWERLLPRLETFWEEYRQQAAAGIADGTRGWNDDEKQAWCEALNRLGTDWKERTAPSLRSLTDEYGPVAGELAVLDEVQAVLDGVFLEAVQDNTVFRLAEADAWFRLFERLQGMTGEQLRAAAGERVSFLQLYKQPAAYRGKLVTVGGTVRRVERYDAPQNLYGIRHYYAVWIKPHNATSPIAVYCLDLPAGFPVPDKAAHGSERTLNEDVEVTGFFFKRWAYRAVDTTRLTPLVLAQTVRWTQTTLTTAGRSSPASGGMLIAIVAGAAVLAVGFALLVYRSGCRESRIREKIRLTEPVPLGLSGPRATNVSAQEITENGGDA